MEYINSDIIVNHITLNAMDSYLPSFILIYAFTIDTTTSNNKTIQQTKVVMIFLLRIFFRKRHPSYNLYIS